MTALLIATASVALIHTLVGVDHYLPFVVLGRARGWSLKRTLGTTLLCGLGHVVGSVLLGFVGIGLGVALDKLVWVEDLRGSIASWCLIGFGLAYATWSILRPRKHTHPQGVAVWSLFIIFVLGPCEPLIPLMMAPAWEGHWLGATAVVATFAIVTIGTMLTTVLLASYGLRLAPMQMLERHAHTLAGLAIALSGIAIEVLGI